jgi:hypothetical protein
MRRRATGDTPAYAADAAASAQLSGPYLAASSGLFLALLGAMSVMEAPIRPWAASGVEATLGAPHRKPPRVRAASEPPACAGPQILTSHPAGEAPARVG